MSNEPKPPSNNYYINSRVNNKEFFGVHSCASCRWIEYNGNVCGSLISPKSGLPINENTWCRYWAPAMQRAPLYKK